MKTRINQRARTDFEVRAIDGAWQSVCRGIELSSTGILLDRGRTVRPADERAFLRLEMHLPALDAPLSVHARPIWSFGSQQAFKFIGLCDADHLSLAECVDRLAPRAG